MHCGCVRWADGGPSHAPRLASHSEHDVGYPSTWDRAILFVDTTLSTAEQWANCHGCGCNLILLVADKVVDAYLFTLPSCKVGGVAWIRALAVELISVAGSLRRAQRNYFSGKAGFAWNEPHDQGQ